jgi:hypothetical protein
MLNQEIIMYSQQENEATVLRETAKYVCNTSKDSTKGLLRGIGLYQQIVQKNDDDYYAISIAYFNLAILYFNRFSFQLAANHFQNSITQVLNTTLNDERYRHLTGLYINLADSYYEIPNKPAGDDAMAYAIKAFSLIKEKSKKELELGDPGVNFTAFYNYFENTLSNEAYLKSSKFNNHQIVQAQTQIAKHEENALFKEFNKFSIDEKFQLNSNMVDMLAKLSVLAPTSQAFFSSVVTNNTTSPDDNCRIMATALLNVSQTQLHQGLLSKTLETNLQIMGILRKIKECKVSDSQTIIQLQNQIDFLQTKLDSSKTMTVDASSSSYQMGSNAAFYQNPINQSNTTNTSNLDLMDNDNDNDSNGDGMSM